MQNKLIQPSGATSSLSTFDDMVRISDTQVGFDYEDFQFGKQALTQGDILRYQDNYYIPVADLTATALVGTWDIDKQLFFKISNNKIRRIEDFAHMVVNGDWTPVFQLAADRYFTLLLTDNKRYKITQPIVYKNDNSTFARYARLPICPNGQAVIDYSTITSATGYNTSLNPDDPLQPAWVAAFSVRGGSGAVTTINCMGINFLGNNNTAALEFKGAGGFTVKNCFFNANRYGVVMNNDVATGTFSECNVVSESRFNSNCQTAIYYYKGAGDSSFHGSGLRDVWCTSTSNSPVVIVSAGAQPYNAPLSGSFWPAGATTPMIKNNGLPCHFHGFLRIEASEKKIIGAGTSTIYFAGEITNWSSVDHGTLRRVQSGGPSGPTGGNLNFAGNMAETTWRYDIAAAGTVVPLLSYNEDATITIRGTTYISIFRIATGRRVGNNVQFTAPQVIYTNVPGQNPLAFYSATADGNNLSITTTEANTIIAKVVHGLLPDESSKFNYSTADHWSSL